MKHSHFSPSKGRPAKKSFSRPGGKPANPSRAPAQDQSGAWSGRPSYAKAFAKKSKRWPDKRRDEARDENSRDGDTWASKPAFGKKPFSKPARDGSREEVKESGRRHTRARTERESDNKWGKPAYGKPFGKKPHYRDDRSRDARDERPRDGRADHTSRAEADSRKEAKGWAKPNFNKHSYGKNKKPDRRPQDARPEKPEYTRRAPVEAPMSLEAEKAARGDTAMLWGVHAVRAAWLNPKRRCFRLWITEAGQNAFAQTMTEAQELLLKRPDVKKVERHELDKITPPGSVHQGIVLEAAPLHEPLLRDIIGVDNPPDLILMLDQVTDPHNVGAILRSAAAFGAGAVIMTERNAPGTTGVLAKAASGAAEHVPQIHVVNLARALDELQEAGYWRVGLAEEGTKEIGELDLSGRTVLVLGAEGDGLRQLTRKKCDELAKLPTGGPVGSLNVSNAAAVGLYEVRRQKKI